MELISIAIRNYRIHKDTTVVFDPKVTVVGGPNESGKSTLVEALHRILFLRAKTGGKLHAEMLPKASAGRPEVELRFRVGACAWLAEKHFGGAAGGSFRLSSDKGESLSDEAAEMRLSALLGGIDMAAGKGAKAALELCWPHLLIRQGDSHQSPEGASKAAASDLLKRLQEEGGAAVLTSAKDELVAQYFAAEAAGLFVSSGKPKAGSSLKVAEDAVEAAEHVCEQARKKTSALEGAVGRFHAAERDIRDLEASLLEMEERIESLQKKLTSGKALEERVAEQREVSKRAEATYLELRGRIEQMIQLENEISAIEATLAPSQAKVAEAKQASDTCEHLLEGKEKARVAVAEAAEQSARRVDWLRARAELLRAADAMESLKKTREIVDALTREQKAKREALLTLPPVSEAELECLRTLQGTIDRTESALEAMAADLEWTEGEGAVLLAGQVLKQGEVVRLTEATELRVNDELTVRLRPGGGEALAKVRLSNADARRAMTAKLTDLEVADLEAAAATLEKRKNLESAMEHLSQRIEEKAGETFAGRIAAAEEKYTLAKATLKRREQGAEPTLSAASLDQVLDALQKAEDALADLRAKEKIAQHEVEQLRARHERERQAWVDASDVQHTRASELASKRGRWGAWVDAEGDAETRAKRLKAAKAASAEESAKATNMEATLARLQLDQVREDLGRLQQSSHQCREKLTQARNERSAAKALLERDGSEDPAAELEKAEGALALARERHQREADQAGAVALLAELFNEEKSRMAAAHSAPLVQRINHYLSAVFGPEGGVQLALGPEGMQGITLARTEAGAFGFDELSHGAREQVATAVRLATAELLAADHEGRLPIVFDDAFTHTDAERLEGVLTMLNRAAQRGLQVIILTCHPKAFHTLPSRTASLR